MSEMKPGHDSGSGREKHDIDVRKVTIYGAGLLLIICATGILATIGVFKKLTGDNTRQSPAPSPMLEASQAPPEPRLQANPAMDLMKYQAAEDAQLKSYGWVDKPNGVVRIPIDRAVALMLEKGMPQRPDARIEAPPVPDSSKPKAPKAGVVAPTGGR